MQIYEKYLSRTCWLEIDLDSITNNIKLFKELAGPTVKVMPAVKANAYGHGILESCKALVEGGADMFGVGSIEEGIRIRDYGINNPILVFASNTIIEVAELYIRENLIPTILSFSQAESISKLADNSPHPIFIKIETGRGRLGINSEEAVNVIKEINSLPGIRIEGIYSHLAGADWPENDNEYTYWQYRRFASVKEGLEANNINIPYYQIANSPGSIALPDIRLSGICPGRAIWGYSPLEKRLGHPKLRQALKAWKSKLIQVKEVCGGKFGPGFKAIQLDGYRRIGIMSAGLVDGVDQKYAFGGEVLIKGQRIPVGSSISLEHTILDLSHCANVKVGDEIVILGKQGNEEITLQELSSQWGRSLTEFLSSLNPNMPRVYFRNREPVSISFGNKYPIFFKAKS